MLIGDTLRGLIPLRQIPLEEKVRLADYVIDTSGTKEQTLEQVRKVYESLRSIAV